MSRNDARRGPGVFSPSNPIKRIYGLLMKRSGAQGWWPVYSGRGSCPEYRRGFYGPHTGEEIFEICVGAILTQNTAWTSALAALACLNKAGALGPGAIALMRPARLERLIRPSGFYRRKAGRLKIFSRYLIKKHPEGLQKWFLRTSAGDLRSELLTLEGIGPETADSMVLYAGGKPKFVIDAYTARIFGRLGLVTGKYEEIQYAFESALPADHRIYNEYHALIVAHGKDFCRKTRPRCAGCPLNRLCKCTRGTYDN